MDTRCLSWPLVLTAPLWRHGNGSYCLSPTFSPRYMEPIASTCPDNGAKQLIFRCYLPETDMKGKAFAFGFCWRRRRGCFTACDSSKVRQCVTADKHLMKSLTGWFSLQQKQKKQKQPTKVWTASWAEGSTFCIISNISDREEHRDSICCQSCKRAVLNGYIFGEMLLSLWIRKV